MKTAIYVPLTVNNRTVGVLVIESRSSLECSDEYKSVLKKLAQAIATLMMLQQNRNMLRNNTNRAINKLAHIAVAEGPVSSFELDPLYKHKPDSTEFDIFAIFPFEPARKNVYINHIERVAKENDFHIVPADESFGPEIVMERIWDNIYSSKCVIADCTGRNPNVFYEIGVAHAIGKKVIFIVEESKFDTDIPFDIKSHRIIKYDVESEVGIKTFNEELKSNFLSILSE